MNVAVMVKETTQQFQVRVYDVTLWISERDKALRNVKRGKEAFHTRV